MNRLSFLSLGELFDQWRVLRDRVDFWRPIVGVPEWMAPAVAIGAVLAIAVATGLALASLAAFLTVLLAMPETAPAGGSGAVEPD